MDQLSKLQRLTLHENQLNALPTNWHHMRWIEDFTFLDNPFKYPSPVWMVHLPSGAGAGAGEGAVTDGRGGAGSPSGRGKLNRGSRASSPIRAPSPARARAGGAGRGAGAGCGVVYYSSLAPLQLAVRSCVHDKLEQEQEQARLMRETRDRFFDYLFVLHEAPRTRRVSLRGRGFARIPPEVLGMTYLTELDLAYNAITALPPQLKAMHDSLTCMDLSYNRLSSLPLDLMYLTKLDECSFEGMTMEFVPKVLRTAGIKHVRRYITEMQAGKESGTLSLVGMKLTSIPDDALRMTNLTELHLEHNEIRHITSDIVVLVRLKNLFVDGNPLRTVPWQIERLTALERISLLDCPIDELPLGLCHMTSLREIRTYSHEMLPRPPAPMLSNDAIMEKTFNLLDQFQLMLRAYETRTLILADMGLSFFPNEAFQITSLTILDISMNNFSSVPNVVGNLNNLELLRLSYNYIPALELDWSGMTSLKRLDLEYNCIAKPFTSSFGALTNLVEVYAHDNLLPTIPKEVSYCASLVHLDLCYNEIAELPPLRGMQSIKWVDLRHNKLTEFPRHSFGYLTSLEYLDVSFNHITRFPPGGEWPRRDRRISFMEEAAVPMDEVVEQGGQGGDGSEAWNGRMVSMKWSGDGEMMLRWGDTLRTLKMHGNYISVLPWDLWVLTSIQVDAKLSLHSCSSLLTSHSLTCCLATHGCKR